MKIIYLTFLAGVALVAPLHADPIADLAAQIKADYAYVYAHPEDPNSEALKALRNTQMVKDMEERDKEVQLAHEAYNKHLQEWIEASRPKQIPNTVTKDNRGNVTETYSNDHPIIVSPR